MTAGADGFTRAIAGTGPVFAASRPLGRCLAGDGLVVGLMRQRSSDPVGVPGPGEQGVDDLGRAVRDPRGCH
jgi:hypothetical protein